jgi:NitT/TauT family transport system substrate-binding protein
MWGAAYSVCNSGIFVAPESRYQAPDDLAGVEVGVGYHSGSHYSAIQGLEPVLARDEIKLAFVGRPFDRVRLMRERRIEAANVFGAQYYLLELAGLINVFDSTYLKGYLGRDDVDRDDLESYFRALRRAQREIDLEAERYKPLWLREIPEDLLGLADVRRFGTGERIVFESYTREMFERTHRWMAAWDLLDPSTSGRSYEDAVLS